MRNLGVVMLVLAASAPVMAAEAFEGIIEMRMTGKAGGGTMKVTVAKAGVRSEMSMAAAGQDPATGMKMTLLFKRDNADAAYLIQDSNKTYRALDLKKARESRAQAVPQNPVVKKLGEEKMNGYPCFHFTVTTGNDGAVAEYWTTRQLLDWDTFVVMQQQREPNGIQKAMKDAGVEGFPVKMIRKQGGEVQMTMDLIKAEKTKVSPSAFEIPAGYTKEDGAPRMGGPPHGGPGGPGGGMPPELMEELKKMSPEERKMFLRSMMQQQPPPPAPAPQPAH